MSRHRKKRSFPRAALAAVAGGVITLAAVFAWSPSGGSQPHPEASPLPAVVLTAPSLQTALKAPEAPRTYAVKSGDTLWTIARAECRDGSKWRDLAKASHITNGDVLKIGERITISC